MTCSCEDKKDVTHCHLVHVTRVHDYIRISAAWRREITRSRFRRRRYVRLEWDRARVAGFFDEKVPTTCEK